MLSINKSVEMTTIIPIHNMEGKLDNLKRTLNHTCYLNIEVILVEDGCSDNTHEELSAIVKNLPDKSNISCYKVSFNNPGESRNFALEKAKGEWITFWDSDDLPCPEKYLELIDNLGGKYNVIIGQYKIYDFKKLKILYQSNEKNLLQVAINPGLWRMIFHRNILQVVRFPALSMAEDQNFICKLNLQSEQYVISEDMAYTYIINFPNQLTKNRSKLEDLLKAILNSLETLEKNQNEFNSIMLIKQLSTYLWKTRKCSLVVKIIPKILHTYKYNIFVLIRSLALYSKLEFLRLFK